MQQSRGLHNAAQRMTQNGSGRTHLHITAVKLQAHTSVVQVVKIARPGPNDQASRRAVVGHHIFQCELEIAIARIDDFHRWRYGFQVVNSLQRSERAAHILACHKADFRLNAWVDVAFEINNTALFFHHLVGDDAPDQAVHAHLNHLGPAGKTKLDAIDFFAACNSALNRGALNLISFRQREMAWGKLINFLSLIGCGIQQFRNLRNLAHAASFCLVPAWPADSASRRLSISRATSTIMSSCPPTMRRLPSSARMSKVDKP